MLREANIGVAEGVDEWCVMLNIQLKLLFLWLLLQFPLSLRQHLPEQFQFGKLIEALGDALSQLGLFDASERRPVLLLDGKAAGVVLKVVTFSNIIGYLGYLAISNQQFVHERFPHPNGAVVHEGVHVLVELLQLMLAHLSLYVSQQFLLVQLVVFEVELHCWLHLYLVQKLEVAVLGFLHAAVLHYAVTAIPHYHRVLLWLLEAVHVSRVLQPPIILSFRGVVLLIEYLFDVVVELHFGDRRQRGVRTWREVLHVYASVGSVLNEPVDLVAVLQVLLHFLFAGLPPDV